MRANRRTDTLPELRLRSELHRRGLRFRKDYRLDLEGLRVRPDIVFTRARVAVFVDGCFWHSCPRHAELPRANRPFWERKLARTVLRDAEASRALEEAGWTVVRVWEHEPVDDAASVVTAALVRAGNRRSRG
jgi:DNA mismatch endonuclease (patch repair protein)